MNPTSTSRTDAANPGATHDGLDLLEARLWDRARRNLRLLYNGGRLASPASPATNGATCPLVVRPKI